MLTLYKGTISSQVSYLRIPKHINQKTKMRLITSSFNGGAQTIDVKAPEFKIYSANEVEDTGVLATFYNQPLSFYDIPTLNLMTYPLQIWEDLLSKDPFTRAALEQHMLWGAADHSDLEYVAFADGGPAIRVNKFWKADQNLILGEVDIIDTFNGRNLLSCAKSGSVGLSSRGTGELLPDFQHGCKVIATDQSGVSSVIATTETEWQAAQVNPALNSCQITNEGFTIVNPDCYINVCWDAVSYPACSEAVMSMMSEKIPSSEYEEHRKEYREANPQTEHLSRFLAASAARTSSFKEKIRASKVR